ncbi:hypothetical protein FA95DRAFT_1527426 [Auriscalpium vulgare]|uniref:Uncharacterized protein n=1 Tax=Auriscalpium vulgare TaxID=40419 RepID=A0ACB8R945_9AGAM|nr:hypothetical protein FA95DRAFT_1527426 [Auriscalpium vulgare]
MPPRVAPLDGHLLRSSSPASPSRSLYDATTAIDDLTRSLADFSRVATPEPLNDTGCCCSSEDCAYTKAWVAVKSKLESRLVLSAEVGQALLQRHEAYVRRVQATERGSRISVDVPDEEGNNDDIRSRSELEDRVSELVKENAVFEKRFNQALLNNEVAESSNKALTHELQEVRAVFGKLSAENARSAGWEGRLRQALQERDDYRQERDNESQRARLAEARLVALGEKCSKLRGQVNRLQEDLEQQRIGRSELSEEILRDARVRLQELQHNQFEHVSLAQHDEVTKILESLVADREVLKKSNVELQNLLSESRENLHALQEEVEESRASTSWALDGETLGRRPRNLRSHSPAMSYGTAPGPLSPISSIFPTRAHQPSRRAASTDPPLHRDFEPLTPETSRPPLSPTESLYPSDLRFSSLAPSHRPSSEHDEDDDEHGHVLSPERPRSQKALYLLQRSRGVQTDTWPGMLAPSPFQDSLNMSSPKEGLSESSSLVESSSLSALLDRVGQLFNRMAQADALTLTSRLKRQNIIGADVSYLSKSTVDSISSEVANLRSIFRGALEDDKFTMVCTRKDLRTLLKLFRDIFRELGNLRMIVNDVVLDPSIAPKVREMALNPSKGEAGQTDRNTSNTGPGSWIAPISKFFSSAVGGSDSKRTASPSPLASPGNRGRTPTRPAPRPVPKLGPATSASVAHVNVEFTGTGAGRAVINATPSPAPPSGPSSPGNVAAPTPSRNVSQSLMGIFAGAPRPEPGDPWVIVPKGVNALRTRAQEGQFRRATATLGRTAGRSAEGTLPRNVDAVIDNMQPSVEERGGYDATVRERTLRPRGLSDSSIRSTFLRHGDEPVSPVESSMPVPDQSRASVLHALSQKVQDLRLAASTTLSGGSSPEMGASPPASASAFPDPAPDSAPGRQGQGQRARSPLSGLLPDLSSWAAAGSAIEANEFVGSVRQGGGYRPWAADARGGDRFESEGM